ncbi:efflux RND transporter periplasmic adaptor subunit [Mucilaginibacter sp. BJC16-A38]|uniref:efflux RND transporter periplasmic adaptor subunit n=1 Tax=Mucilaginibacter phenanthrenivorans TaxID=1234842 RepID=UPI002157FC50|nr:efflux RND transporter periplasmic adaptor subunit [Mucilaginibacter phenanthrenivorans]MCR8556521.1 efflux RND transporter periplasmic adaptor subunit [Mucilaginibacter phenanthrenivorans]
MKKNTKRTLVIAAIIIVVGGIWFITTKKKEKLVVLPTEVPTYGYIAQTVTATGTIQPVDTVAVGTQVSGIVKVINADFNSKVKKGQLLAQLDKSLLQATVDQASATLRTQQSQLVYNENFYNRQKLLYSSGSISKQDYESALNNFNSSKAAVDNASAALRSAEKNLSYTDIYSPVDGVVLSRSVSLGQTVAAAFSTPTLFVIAKDISKMQVQADVDEADIGNVKIGNRASFTVDAYIDDVFKGTVYDVRLHPKSTSNVVTYTTIIYAPNDSLMLKPGMTANISVYTKEVKNALMVSSKSLNFAPDSPLRKQFVLKPMAQGNNGNATNGPGKPGSVWLKKGKELVQTPVRYGLDDNTHAEILAGLSVKDTIVSSLPVPVQAEAGTSILPSPGGADKNKKP